MRILVSWIDRKIEGRLGSRRKDDLGWSNPEPKERDKKKSNRVANQEANRESNIDIITPRKNRGGCLVYYRNSDKIVPRLNLSSIGRLRRLTSSLNFLKHQLKLRTTHFLVRPIVDGNIIPQASL